LTALAAGLIGSAVTAAVVQPAPMPGPLLTLDDAIRLALQRNHRVRVSTFSRDIARANVLAEYGRFDPALTFRHTHAEEETPGTVSPLAASITRTDDTSLAFGGSTPWGMSYSIGGSVYHPRGGMNPLSDRYVTFGGVTVTQPLLRGFGFGTNLYGLRVARADRSIADWLHRQTVIDTVTNVIFAYNNLTQAREALKIARLSHQLATQLLEQNVRRNEIGSIADAEVTQARASVANREESILVAERAVRDFENQLRLLIGESVFPADGTPIEIEPLPPASPFTVDFESDLRLARELRPDLQAARAGIDKRRYHAALAANQLLPRVDLVGSYGYTGVDRDFGASRAQVRNQDFHSYSAGVVVSIPLTFAEGRGRSRAARLALRQGEADLERLDAETAVAIAAAAGQIETTRGRVAATRTALELANQALEAEQRRLNAGTSNTFFVARFQESLIDVQNRYARALADERRAIAHYEREIGVTLNRHHISIE
jgi:outer membrane protein